jgi:hypothetical protein
MELVLVVNEGGSGPFDVNFPEYSKELFRNRHGKTSE